MQVLTGDNTRDIFTSVFIQRDLTRLYGGCTTQPGSQGIWIDEGTTYTDQVTTHTSYTDMDTLDRSLTDLIDICTRLRNDTDQICISLIIDGSLYFI